MTRTNEERTSDELIIAARKRDEMREKESISFARTLHGTPGRNRGNFHRHRLVLQPLVYLLLLLGHDIADAHDVCLLF